MMKSSPNLTEIGRQSLNDNLIDIIPGGAAGFRVSDNKVIFARGGLLNLTGYSCEEFLGKDYGWHATHLYPEDRSWIKDELLRQIEKTGKSALECRFIKKDGTTVWIKVYAGFMDSPEWGLYLLCIFLDNTKEKYIEMEAAHASQELRLASERYRIILEQSEDVIFDWNMMTGSVYHSPVFEQKFGYAIPVENTVEYLKATDIIYEDDKPRQAEILRLLESGQPYAETEYRIKKKCGSYIWCRVRSTVIFDENNKPYRAIGVISDIDEYKRETAYLQDRAEKDLLTGLLNKITAQERIEGILEQSDGSQMHALYLIDIDNFKWINDNMGHLLGDKVLSEISMMIRENFRETDIAGRVGGDEFVVMMESVSSIEAVRQKAEVLSEIFRRSFCEKGKKCRVSGSIGIAIYPQHGRTLQELYETADHALYCSKRKGKDCFSFSEECPDRSPEAVLLRSIEPFYYEI